MLTRGAFYLLTMAGVLVVVGVVANIIFAVCGVQMDQMSFLSLMGICTVMGFGGSIISIFMSKTLVKKQMGVQIITHPSSENEKWLVETVAFLAKEKGVKMPEVGIYPADEMNAFATGWNKNDALVAVSTGLFNQMSQEEIAAVLGHEMSHVSNGDMVTMCLIQGIMSAFVYFIAFIVARAIASRIGKGAYFLVFRLVQYTALATLGFLGQLVVLMFSRWREFRADAGSADILGAEPMIKALETLKAGYAVDRQNVIDNRDPVSNSNTSMLCISDREMAGIFGDWRRSHPSLQKRIEVLKERSR